MSLLGSSEGVCGFCEGDGKCSACDGTGVNPHFNEPEPKCQRCCGTGTCPHCLGSGTTFGLGSDIIELGLNKL